MSERQRKSREDRLADQAHRSAGLAPFFMHPDVQAFFNKFEMDCVEAVADADASDDETRRNAGMKLQAMRQFRKEMSRIIETGERAKGKLEALEHE